MKKLIAVAFLPICLAGLHCIGCSSDESKEQSSGKAAVEQGQHTPPWQDNRTPEEKEQAKEQIKRNWGKTPYKNVPVPEEKVWPTVKPSQGDTNKDDPSQQGKE